MDPSFLKRKTNNGVSGSIIFVWTNQRWDFWIFGIHRNQDDCANNHWTFCEESIITFARWLRFSPFKNRRKALTVRFPTVLVSLKIVITRESYDRFFPGGLSRYIQISYHPGPPPPQEPNVDSCHIRSPRNCDVLCPWKRWKYMVIVPMKRE